MNPLNLMILSICVVFVVVRVAAAAVHETLGLNLHHIYNFTRSAEAAVNLTLGSLLLSLLHVTAGFTRYFSKFVYLLLQRYAPACSTCSLPQVSTGSVRWT